MKNINDDIIIVFETIDDVFLQKKLKLKENENIFISNDIDGKNDLDKDNSNQSNDTNKLQNQNINEDNLSKDLSETNNLDNVLIEDDSIHNQNDNSNKKLEKTTDKNIYSENTEEYKLNLIEMDVDKSLSPIHSDPNIKEIDSSNDRSSVKYIKNLRKNRIRFEKNEYKSKIKNTTNKDEIKNLRTEYKNKFKKGIQNNSEGYIIELKHVNKYYFTSGRYERILKDINLRIPEGKFILILGPSGTGKTTLLNVVSGLDTVTSGDIVVADRNLFYLDDNSLIKFRADNLSFVFQSYNLISTLNVLENIKIGENLRNPDTDKIELDEIIESLGLTSQVKKYPYQMSGGQQQRVSIARALAKNPRILFADEPTGALDEERGRETIKLLMDINKKYNTTLVIVTHNPNLQSVADIVIKIKDGKIDKLLENKNKLEDITKLKWG